MIVCVGGMHRSGTSMVTNLLRLCGLHLGAETDMLPPAIDNPEGYWESVKFRELNDEILTALGGKYDAPPRPPKGWEEREELGPLREKAEAILRELATDGHWGWKDPRNSLTLPFWLSLLPQMKVIICVRNPLEVALSERRRWERLYVLNRPHVSAFPLYLDVWKFYDSVAGALSIRPPAIPPYHRCFTLWQIYYQEILASTRPENRLITHYDNYFIDAEAELRRGLNFLCMDVSDEQIADSLSAISEDLRHHRAATRKPLAARVPRAVVKLYSEVCAEACFERD
jgi:hypothetical protein